MLGIQPQHPHRSAIGLAHPLQALDGGRLPRAVRPHHPEDLAAAYLEGHAVHRGEAPYALRRSATCTTISSITGIWDTVSGETDHGCYLQVFKRSAISLQLSATAGGRRKEALAIHRLSGP